VGRGELAAIAQEHERKRQIDREKLEKIMEYGQIASCRWKFLLDYFGEEVDWDKCGNCDNCLNPPEKWIGSERKAV
jgi:ATP-dependent DNA helicase RecQ